MKNRTVGNGDTTLATVFKYFGAIMALVYIGAGLLILLQAGSFYNVPMHYSVPLGIMLMAYGFFRGYRVYKKFFQPDHESET